MKEIGVLWAIAAAGVLGLLLGLKYKVVALIAASMGISILTIAVALHKGYGLGAIVLATFVALVTMQLAYAVGLAISGRPGWAMRRPLKRD
jgi:hypothetical protein